MEADLDDVAAALPAYEIGSVLGTGGFGIVVAGRHRALDRAVAIKQLPPHFATDVEVRHRFLAEGRLLASLDHPNVVRVFDFVERDGLCLLVMELLTGGTVWDRFTTSGFDARSAVAVVLASASGLAAAHERGILHRDIKPENVMFAASGVVKVTDFGIAKVLGGDSTLATRAGDVLGTPSYIAPEQARGAALSPATDVYALATMLYELLAGTLPFPEGGDAMSLLFKHAFDRPRPLLEAAPTLPVGIAQVVMKGLATNPTDRFPTAEAFATALTAATGREWGADWGQAQPIPLTEVPRTGPPPTAAGHPETAAEPVVTPLVVQSSVTAHARGAAAKDVELSELLPVQHAVVAPSSRSALIAAAACVAALLLVALVGIGSPSAPPPPPLGTVEVAGNDPAARTPLLVDLAAPVPLVASAQADSATLELRLLGVTVKSQTAPAFTDGTFTSATLPPLGGEHFLAGAFTGELILSRNGREIAAWGIPVRSTQGGLFTAGTVAVVGVLLFAAAYLESFLRPLRHRRRRISGRIGAAGSGAVLGLGVVGAAWVIVGTAPTVPTVAVAMALGAGGGWAAAIAAWRFSHGRRLRQARSNGNRRRRAPGVTGRGR